MQPKQVLVALAGTSVDPDVIRIAVAIARPAKGAVTAVHVIEVPWHLPLDAVLDAALDKGEELLTQAAHIAEQAGLKIETELLQAREAAAAIVDTAREKNADVIVLGMPYRRRSGRVYVGKTVETVYVSAHCAVLAYRQEAPS